MPRKDSLGERLIKWIFWLVLIIYLFSGFYQIRYWLGESFGWGYNHENETLEVQGVGQILEGGSFVVVFLLLYGVYYLWKETGTKNNWESIFNNNKSYLKETHEVSITSIGKMSALISTKSFWKTLLHITLGIGIIFIPIVIFLILLDKFQIFGTIILIGYGILMLMLYIIGRKD